VIEKDLVKNSLIVGPREELGRRQLLAARVNWVSGQAPTTTFRGEVKIRYKSQPAWASLTPLPGDRVQVYFDEALRDITPGQAAVFYDGERVLGGGIIQPAETHTPDGGFQNQPAGIAVE
jgi:tRNA-specific 2-thiouridylase